VQVEPRLGLDAPICLQSRSGRRYPAPEPVRGESDQRQRGKRSRPTGGAPSPLSPSPARRLRTRCRKAQDICGTREPPAAGLIPGHQVACHLPAGAAPAA